jgi:hypothetical protein
MTDDAKQPGGSLAEKVYLALRDGEPVLDLALELAMVAYDVDKSRPARFLVENTPTEAQARRAAVELLGVVGYDPGFTLAANRRVRAELALATVERDVRAQGLTGRLELTYPTWTSGRTTRPAYDGKPTGEGVDSVETSDPDTLLVAMAFAVQESITESKIAWPVCSTHHTALHPELRDTRPIWLCPVKNPHEEAEIGALPTLPPARRQLPADKPVWAEDL